MIVQDICHFANHAPNRRIRLTFHSTSSSGERQIGTLDVLAKDAIPDNRSDRYFPPAGETPITLKWPVPWFYLEELVAWETL